MFVCSKRHVVLPSNALVRLYTYICIIFYFLHLKVQKIVPKKEEKKWYT
jgi:hypothetical protein